MGCIRCGMCCMVCDVKWEEIKDKNKSGVLDRLRWLNLHRCDTQIISRKDGGKHALLRIPLVCRMLDQKPDGKFFCKDYENRPQLCRDYKCMRARKDDDKEKGTPKNLVEPASPPQG